MNQPFNNLDFVAQATELDMLLRKYEIKSVIEIGSFLGATARFFADRGCSVICIDPFKTSGEWLKALEARGIPNPYFDVFVENMKHYGVWDKISILVGHSQDWDIYQNVPVADMVYVDGGHSYQEVKEDIRLYTSKAKKLLVGDDCHLDESGNPYYPGVVKAMNELPTYQMQRYTWWSII